MQVPVEGGQLPGYFARPQGAGPFPTVIVVEEIFGVHEYIKDTCRRLAKLGYLAVAAELYARLGDLSKMTDAAAIVRDVISKAPDATVLADLDALVDWAAANGGDPNRLGITGFCRGGRAVWLYDAHSPRLKAAVAWYGPIMGTRTDIQPQDADRRRGPPALPAARPVRRQGPGHRPGRRARGAAKARAAGSTVEMVLYPDAGHALPRRLPAELRARRGGGRLGPHAGLVPQIRRRLATRRPVRLCSRCNEGSLPWRTTSTRKRWT